MHSQDNVKNEIHFIYNIKIYVFPLGAIVTALVIQVIFGFHQCSTFHKNKLPSE